MNNPYGKCQDFDQNMKVNIRDGDIRYERWESDEYVITIHGKPVGQTLSKRNADIISRWLITAINEIKN